MDTDTEPIGIPANGNTPTAPYFTPDTLPLPTTENDIYKLASENFAGLQHTEKLDWLLAFATCGRIDRSSKLTGIHRMQHYSWLRRDPLYAEAFKLAQSFATDAWEDEMARRAFEGTEHGYYQSGKLLEKRREYSDLLAIFLTKGARPKKYADRVTLDIEDRVRQVAAELGVDPEEAVQEAQRLAGQGPKLLGPGKR